jgi:phosphoglycerate dehydrogenase-like enzyme
VFEIGGGLPDGLDAEVLFGGWGPYSPEAVATRGIQWVQLSGTGFDGVRPSILEAPLVTVARGASAVPISEYVLAAMLACEKDLPANWLREQPKHWNFQRMDALAGKTLGLVGIGGIGSRVARLARAFDMDVVALRRHPEAGSPVDGVRVTADLDEVLAAADHLVLAAPATARTRQLLDGDAFGRVRPGVHLVNIARGDLVDQDALRVALDDGTVARASLDTVTPEPLPEGHWMYSHPKVFLTPHSSWSSPAFFDAAIEIFLDNLGRYRAGDRLLHVIDREEGY